MGDLKLMGGGGKINGWVEMNRFKINGGLKLMGF